MPPSAIPPWHPPARGGPLPALPPPFSAAPSVFAFSLAKAGSTLLNDLLRVLAPAAGLAFFSIEDALFASGIPAPIDWPQAARLFHPRGYCYGGFRAMPRHPLPPLASCRAVLLVRDPRDMIVSQFHSFRASHLVPEDAGPDHPMHRAREAAQRQTLAQFAPGAAQRFARRFEGYLAQGFAFRETTAVFRYEDVVFAKRAWVEGLCAWFGWDLHEAVRAEAAARFDVLPAAADPARHIRQVHPGNHLSEMSAATRAQVEAVLAESMTAFGYR
ncbi:sulfotransferase domain-containing protein [Roseomonas fluvialis]|uniref:Sulfotransferase domain-containing protein n=1 Tax=Roseomonas fluvialis TaxID=1750527 RepID=A0ABM7Y3M1_9PROT|nr:sulfotransferase domain-containing protein [Roseomonas fluvialis]BDG72459.1 hypothetical protein Rmf_23880 [Roseomonas fluvialis]